MQMLTIRATGKELARALQTFLLVEDTKLMEDDPLFRRIRKHAQKRLVFHSGQSNSNRLEMIKEFSHLEKEMLHRYHLKGDSGLRLTRARAIVIDVLIQSLFEYALKVADESLVRIKPMSVLATGGYGRGELSPHSDVDLMFLYPRSSIGKSLELLKETMTREILYPLWDCGMKVGHASREVKEALLEAQRDIRNKNSMLDARYICGDRRVASNFVSKFLKHCRQKKPEEYLKELLLHQKTRRNDKGDTVFLQAPDLKNGVGGLRDYQGILWMAKARFEEEPLTALIKRKYLNEQEAKAFQEAYSFLLRVRNEVHFRSKRPLDVLHLEKQPEVALGLGYLDNDIFPRVEKFMGDYYARANTIHQVSKLIEERLVNSCLVKGKALSFRAVLQAYRSKPSEKLDGFELINDELDVRNHEIFQEDPERILRLFRLSQRLSVKLSAGLRSMIRNNLQVIDATLINSPSANVTFRSILQEMGNVAPTLLQMHELGVLGRFIPEFGRLTCKVQHDLYHRFTADVHVLRCMEILDEIFQGKRAGAGHYLEALRKNEVPGLLYLILFIHDLGKDRGPKGHCERGVEIGKSLMKRLGISEEMVDRVLFVVKNHLEMVRFANKFDLDDPEVIDSFASFVEGEQRLRFLYVHTYCDANGTAPDLWSSHKEELHTQLFTNTIRVLEGKRARKDPNEIRDSFKDLEVDGVSKETLLDHLDRVPLRYFAHTGREEVSLHVQMVDKYSRCGQPFDQPIVSWRNDLRRTLTVVDVVVQDQSALFERITGALSVAGLNILGARAVTRIDHLAIDVFYVEREKGGIVDDPETMTFFESTLKDFLSGKTSPDEQISEHRRSAEKSKTFSNKERFGATIPPQVDVYRDVSLGRTIVEVRAADRIGLLHLISKHIAEAGFSIVFARIATEQKVATDVFNIEPIDKDHLPAPREFLDLRENLGNALLQGKYYHEV